MFLCSGLNTMLRYVLPGTCTSVFVSILGLLRDPLPPTSYILLACFSCNVGPLLVSFSRTGSRLPPRPRVPCRPSVATALPSPPPSSPSLSSLPPPPFGLDAVTRPIGLGLARRMKKALWVGPRLRISASGAPRGWAPTVCKMGLACNSGWARSPYFNGRLYPIVGFRCTGHLM
jgi:hypothetical protein